MSTKKKQHDPAIVYTIYVLWLIGYTKSFIAKATNNTEKQVEGIISRSQYSNRAEMSDSQRAKYLSECEAMRCLADGTTADKGLLENVEFRIKKLSQKQSGLERLKSRLDNMAPGRDGQTQIFDAKSRQRLLSVDKNAGVLEFFLHEGKLAYGDVEHKEAFIRFEAGIRLRNYYQGAQIGFPSGLDLSQIRVDGGKGFEISDHQSDCMAGIRKCKKALSSKSFDHLDRVCVKDYRGWESYSKTKMEKFIADTCWGLDKISSLFGEITNETFEERWNC